MPRRKKTAAAEASVVDTFTSPESANVEGASYTPDTKQLVIAFRDKKKEGAPIKYYYYDNYPSEEWLAFKQAESKGEFVSKRIKPHYQGIPIQ